MGFMKPQVSFFAAYLVETNHGTEVVPEDVCGTIVDTDDEGEWDILYDYLENDNIRGVERVEGWWCRLSANGFLDCTGWEGPFDTQEAAQEAIDAVLDDQDGDEIEAAEGTTCVDLPDSAERPS
jgi:hypothetical protein